MPYRPYPNARRALAQLHRHTLPEPEPPTGEGSEQLETTPSSSEPGFDVDEYRLSTRG